MTTCVCGKLPQNCECHALPTREEMVELAKRYRGQRRIARELGVSRPTARAFLAHYDMLSRGGRPRNGSRDAYTPKATRPQRRGKTGRELRYEAGWPSLEKWRGELWKGRAGRGCSDD